MASAEEPGRLRIKFGDKNESVLTPVCEIPTKMVSVATKAYPTGANLTAIQPLGAYLIKRVFCRGRIIAMFVSDAADTVESEECCLTLPIRVWRDNNGKPGEFLGNKDITFETMTGFTAAGTVDVVCSAGYEARLAYEDVPTGLIYELNPLAKAHVYMGDDTA